MKGQLRIRPQSCERINFSCSKLFILLNLWPSAGKPKHYHVLIVTESGKRQVLDSLPGDSWYQPSSERPWETPKPRSLFALFQKVFLRKRDCDAFLTGSKEHTLRNAVQCQTDLLPGAVNWVTYSSLLGKMPSSWMNLPRLFITPDNARPFSVVLGWGRPLETNHYRDSYKNTTHREQWARQ